jgi:hypothetical protein
MTILYSVAFWQAVPCSRAAGGEALYILLDAITARYSLVRRDRRYANGGC